MSILNPVIIELGVGVTLRDYFAAKAPICGEEYINLHMSRDKSLNRHNEAHKPKLRSRVQIICQWNYEYADAMIAERNKA